MNNPFALKPRFVKVMLALVPLWILMVQPAWADWPNTNATKFVQMPDLTPNGMDIYFGNSPTILADDFTCTNTGPVTDIHLWISSLQNVPATGAAFELSIWSDVPGSPAAGLPSHPGQRLWSQVFAPGQYKIVAPWATNLQEQFWNLEVTPPQLLGPDTTLFQYNFYPTNPFVQTGSAASPAIYWLGVSVFGNQPLQGWKTSTNRLAPDDAVLGHYQTGSTGISDWKELRDPRGANGPSLNFSFALTTTNPPPPQLPCPETNGVKFLQRPNLDGGLDVLASAGLALADDFLCTNSGPVTDIHVWGSWLQNTVDLNVPIWLGIYSDVPALPGAGPSHPGSLLWQQWFGPGQYSENLWGTGIEQFYDPSKPAILGPDTQAYYLCFFPTNPFVQKGTPAAPTTYWLSLYAQTTPTAGRLFGWKNSSDKFQDDAVWVPWPGAAPTGGWKELVDLAGNSLNLAFKLTTPTNPCPPVPVACPVAKTVDCGANWVFDPPTFPTNNCCGANVTVSVVSTITNGVCPQLITRTWRIVDCTSHTNFCSQVVTVVDTTPPTLICANDKIIPCDVTWNFDAPTVSDRCCSNVALTVLSTVTNGICPQLITRTWRATDCCSNSITCSQTVTVLCCLPPSTNKWVQYPDLVNGLDVLATRPTILADDFLCTATGPITNIQVWGSWQDDGRDPNVQFVLGIWSDVPPLPSGGFSHPGSLLWSATLTTNDYTSALYTNSNEQFFNPNTGVLSPEKQIWRDNFNLKQPYCQQGSSNKPVIYWLSVTAITPNGRFFGWKTSTNHFKDDAVYGHVNAAGTALGDWKDLHDPRPAANNISLDLAFLINSGPAGPDCDPNQRPKYSQWPDPSTNGLDVRATASNILADDFPCRIPGPISGITVWGSWLNDVVDKNARFQLSLWSDVPGIPGTTNVSHPGQLLCTTLFDPPTAIGTSLQRYRFRLDTAPVQETFYDPNKTGTSGFIGNDTQIWRYDFYPPLSCWYQRGTPFKPQIYWLSVSYLPGTNQAVFGWKTSTNHFQDDSVFGHLGVGNNPLNDWKDLHDPRSNKSLDLSFALRTFPTIGINKDLKNTTTNTAGGIQILLAGVHEITWHYDDSPPWPIFQATYVAGNTLLTWSGKTVASGAISHVGFQMAGTTLPILALKWLDTAGNVIGPAIQVGHHMLGNATTLVLDNTIAGIPLQLSGGTVEVYSNNPPTLDQMVVGGARAPFAMLPFGQTLILPTGSSTSIPIPTAPAGAQYLLLVFDLDPAAISGAVQPKGPGSATTDFILVPLNEAMPPVIESIDSSGGDVAITWASVPGLAYQLQTKKTIDGPSWSDAGDVVATDFDTTLIVPIGGDQGYYRVALMPLP